MEAVIVVMIVGILAMIAVATSYEPDRLALARDQIIRHLRYAQHLAVMDDKFDPDDSNWTAKKWRVRFSSHGNPIYVGGKPNGWSYSVFSDKEPKPNNAPAISEMAVDPLTKKRLSGGFNSSLKSDDPRATPEMALWYWKVENIVFSNCLQTIGFDEIGRPYNMHNNSASVTIVDAITTTCKITLENENKEKASLCVYPETGRVSECD
jgi:hypothetical protein